MLAFKEKKSRLFEVPKVEPKERPLPKEAPAREPVKTPDRDRE